MPSWGHLATQRSIGWYLFGFTPRGLHEGAAVLNSVSGSDLPPDHARYLHGGPSAVASRCRDAASIEARGDGPQ